ncbi:hypothetical protein [Mucilaginibacter litoreus]|uniref:hypothetical protein n=1 Tax=Mucilaginibacter litoreus TaxID=1048221 RepID=UPI0036724985
MITGVLLLLGGLYACDKPQIKETGAELKYFDLKGFFKADSARLAKLNPMINKTVDHNGEKESKQLHIANWGAEFNLFKESDINKPSWRNSYSVQQNADSTVYKARYPELKTRQIIIRKTSGKITSVTIYNSTHNFLYSTTERLVYAPDAYYYIEKDQHIKLIGNNNYRIKANFSGAQQQ